MKTQITRADIAAWASNAPPGIRDKIIRFVEELFVDTQSTSEALAGTVEATGSIQNATVLTLSSNAAFDNERVLTAGDGVKFTDDGPGQMLTVAMDAPIKTVGGYSVTFNLPSDVILNLPALGRIPSSDDGPYATDGDAAAAGIGIGEIYKGPAGLVTWRQV